MPKLCNILITHEPADAVGRMLACWEELDPDSGNVVAYGGSRDEFERIEWPSKVLVEDPALRTWDHPRERQSYQGVFRAALSELERQGCDVVHIAEYDQVPIIGKLGERLCRQLREEDADLLGHGLRRVDGSSHPHWLNHIHDAWFGEYWNSVSCRESPTVIFTMLGCGCVWKMDALRAVAALDPPGRIYLELFLPTAAHHLGFRVRSFGEQVQFMHPHHEKRAEDMDLYRSQGAWSVHPVKGMWMDQSQV